MKSCLASMICPLGQLFIGFSAYEFDEGSRRPTLSVDSCTKSIGWPPILEWDGLAHDDFMKRFVGQQRIASNIFPVVVPVVALKVHGGIVNQLVQIGRNSILPQE